MGVNLWQSYQLKHSQNIRTLPFRVFKCSNCYSLNKKTETIKSYFIASYNKIN